MGYATPHVGGFSLDVFFVAGDEQLHRRRPVTHERETAPDSGPFVCRQPAVRPVCVVSACQCAAQLSRGDAGPAGGAWPDGWMADINYTWSQFEGNFDLDYSNVGVFNMSSFIQDAPAPNIEDPNRFRSALRRSPARAQTVHVLAI